MTRHTGLAILAAITLGVASCGQGTGKGDKKAEAGKKLDAPAPEALVDAYLAIQKQLADDSIDAVDGHAATAITAAEELTGEPGLDVLVAGAGRVAARDIATARAGFRKMSDGLIAYLKAHPEARKGREIIHCPMAFNNDGADWVQAEGEILNPYHGKMMLHCGDRVAW